MGAKTRKRLLITLLSCICVLSMDAGALLLVRADNTANGSGTENGETVLGTATVVGGKAVVLMNPASTAVVQEISEEVKAGEEQTVYKPQVKQVLDGRILDAAYYKKQSLSQYTFPEEVESIGDFAFARSGLTEAVIPQGVTSIGYGAFYHCDKLTNVEIPDSVTQIEPFAFDMTAWVQQWRSEQAETVAAGKEAYLVVGDGILIAYEGNKKKVTIPAGVKKIAGSVFQNRTEITAVVFPSSLTEIGESAFENCSSLTSISGHKKLEIIRDKAFSGCPITEIQLPETLTEIGRDAFHENTQEQTAAAVVFQGSKLPRIGYTNRATRLSNTAYRNPSLEGISVAVVPKEVSSLKGTVLDPAAYGFAGIVCRMDGNRASNQKGTLTVITVNGKVSAYPETVSLSGITYQIQDPNGLVEKSRESELEPGLTYHIDSAQIKPSNYVSAALKAPDTAYELWMTQSTIAQNTLADAYRETYGKEPPARFYGFGMSMQDTRAGVPIYKLGEQTLTMTLPLAQGLDSGRVKLAILGDNGLLKEVSVTASTKQGTGCISFTLDRIAELVLYEEE